LVSAHDQSAHVYGLLQEQQAARFVGTEWISIPQPSLIMSGSCGKHTLVCIHSCSRRSLDRHALIDGGGYM
jgi:hypothetical protein